MEFPHEGESIYYRYQAIFARDWYGDLLYCTGPQADRIRDHWESISIDMQNQNYASIDQAQFHRAKLGEALIDLELYEFRQAHKGVFTGIFLSKLAEPTTSTRDLETFFNQIILRQVNFATTYQFSSPSPSSPDESATEKIVWLFDTYLRYQGENEKWDESGRAYFTERVRHFTSQGRRVEFCLPAFPCKSSNTNKVTGKDPDRGEQLALEHLHGFVEAIEQIYDGGAKLWIISDGHVFSDCIGVDDEDVDSYGQKLIEMNYIIGHQRGNPDRVGFKSLIDLFELEKYKRQSKLIQVTKLDTPTIEHFVKTRLTVEAELSRRLLMAGCQSQRMSLRARIDSQDAAILALYRGFSRFMLEDLELHPFTRTMSRSKQKKLSSKVAFEMIMRNQAYSNLVELLFPNHIRLSIHAHNNAGPKFGIRLFDPVSVRAVESLSPDSNPMMYRDLLHIPTPWHNCVVAIAGNEALYMTKAKVVRDALATGGMTGSLVTRDERIDSNCAAYFAMSVVPLGEANDGVQEPDKQQETPMEPQQAIASKEDISMVTIPLTGHPQTSPTAIACDADYVFV